MNHLTALLYYLSTAYILQIKKPKVQYIKIIKIISKNYTLAIKKYNNIRVCIKTSNENMIANQL